MYPLNIVIFHVDMLNQQWVNLLIYVIDMELKHRHQNHQGRPRTSMISIKPWGMDIKPKTSYFDVNYSVPGFWPQTIHIYISYNYDYKVLQLYM